MCLILKQADAVMAIISKYLFKLILTDRKVESNPVFIYLIPISKLFLKNILNLYRPSLKTGSKRGL